MRSRLGGVRVGSLADEDEADDEEGVCARCGVVGGSFHRSSSTPYAGWRDEEGEGGALTSRLGVRGEGGAWYMGMKGGSANGMGGKLSTAVWVDGRERDWVRVEERRGRAAAADEEGRERREKRRGRGGAGTRSKLGESAGMMGRRGPGGRCLETPL